MKAYRDIKNKYPDCEIILTGHSLGGAVAQLVGAETGCKTVTFNAPGVAHLLHDKSKNPKSYSNITNYSLANDILNITNIIGSYEHVGETRIIPSTGKGPIDAHRDFTSLRESASMPYKEWEKQNSTAVYALRGIAATNPVTRRMVLKNILSSNIYRFGDIKKIIESKLQNNNQNETLKKSPFSYDSTQINKTKQGPYETLFRNLESNGMFKHTKVLIDGKKPTEQQWKNLAEGYSEKLDGVKHSDNRGKGPHGEDGYWFTTKNGKHIFVPDDKKTAYA